MRFYLGAYGRRRRGVSNTVFAAVVMALIVVAGVSVYGAYALGVESGTSHVSTSQTTSVSSAGLPSGAISISGAMALMRAPLAGARVSSANDSITFAPSSSINIAAFATTQVNATAFTGMRPPSYAQGDVYVIGGLIDPTLYLPSGTSVTFTVVNMDDALYHDLVVSTVGPPFAANLSRYTTWSGNGVMGSGFQGFAHAMSVLSPANYGGGWASSYSYTVTIPDYANLWYLCTYPGHAMEGMYGEIVTTGNGGATTSTNSTSTSFALPGTMAIGEAHTLLKEAPAGASVSASANSITFTSTNISLTVFTMMPDDASNLTGMNPPSYAQDDVFVIGGLIDPTLYIPKGASVHVTVANLDEDMYHDFDVTNISPPYPYMLMQGMMWGGGYFLYMMPVLSSADYTDGWAPTYSYTVTIPNVSALWYVCTYPGHAETGMYGSIVTT